MWGMNWRLVLGEEGVDGLKGTKLIDLSGEGGGGTRFRGCFSKEFCEAKCVH